MLSPACRRLHVLRACHKRRLQVSVPNKRFVDFYRGFVAIERTTGDQSTQASCFLLMMT